MEGEESGGTAPAPYESLSATHDDSFVITQTVAEEDIIDGHSSPPTCVATILYHRLEERQWQECDFRQSFWSKPFLSDTVQTCQSADLIKPILTSMQSETPISFLEVLVLVAKYVCSWKEDNITSWISIPPEQQFLIRLWLSLYLFGGSVGSSSKKHLLAQDGWSEIWKIVLLVSGDVERNPGPNCMTDEELKKVSEEVIEVGGLTAVYNVVLPVSSKWYGFCIYLGLQAPRLDVIAKNNPNNTDDCLMCGLKDWLMKNYKTEEHGPPTWRKLVEAVGNPSGGENRALALKIADKQKKPDPILAIEASVQQSVTDPVPDTCISDEVSIAFAKMCHSITRLLGKSVDVYDLKLFLCFLCEHDPQSGRLKRSVNPGIYDEAASTEDVIRCLCPDHINPVKLLVLEGIVKTFGSSQCKRLLTKYKKSIAKSLR